MKSGIIRTLVICGILSAIVACASAPKIQHENQPVAEKNQPTLPSPPETPVAERAQALLSQGKIAEAEVILAAEAKNHPESKDAQILYASVLISDGKGDTAIGILDAALTARPEDADLLFTESVVEASRGNQNQQEALLKRAVAKNPEHSDSLEALGELSLDAKDYKTAGSYFQRSLQASLAAGWSCPSSKRSSG
jgi:tetratricopeptide (TPR) repeat protein